LIPRHGGLGLRMCTGSLVSATSLLSTLSSSVTGPAIAVIWVAGIFDVNPCAFASARQDLSPAASCGSLVRAYRQRSYPDLADAVGPNAIGVIMIAVRQKISEATLQRCCYETGPLSENGLHACGGNSGASGRAGREGFSTMARMIGNTHSHQLAFYFLSMIDRISSSEMPRPCVWLRAKWTSVA
jgi:hypothetical protein